jgi:anti-anti-sigma factor
MGNLTYINSWGLGLLVALLSMIRKKGGDVRLARVLGNIHNLFIVTQ